MVLKAGGGRTSRQGRAAGGRQCSRGHSGHAAPAQERENPRGCWRCGHVGERWRSGSDGS
jgi:hypothetical protein